MADNSTPALDPQTRELRLRIAEVRLMEPDKTQHRLVVTKSHPGPWEFIVPL